MISAYECILNAVQCNITILTTKSKWYSWSAAFIWFCWLGAHFTTLLACSSMMVPGMFWSYDWAVYCTTLMYLSQSFRHPPPPPLPPISTVNSLRQALGRLHGSHGWVAGIDIHGSVMSRGWLITVEVPGYPTHPSSIQHDVVANIYFLLLYS